MLNRIKIFIPIVLGILLMVLLLNNKATYTVIVNKIDDQSPARLLSVYKDEKQIVFKEIRYSDDVFLCTKDNPTVFYGDVENEKELKVVFDDNNYVMAKVAKGD